MDKTQWFVASEQLLAHLKRSGITHLPRPQAELPAEIAAWPSTAQDASARIASGPQSTPSPAPPAPSQRDVRRAPAPEEARPSAAARVVAASPSASSSPWETPPLPDAEREQTLAVLAEQVAACRKCTDICARRLRTVFGTGPRNARLVMFGEAPGAEEDRMGEPFVGAAGQLLDKILIASGLSRQEVYIMNSLKCRPPGNRTPTDLEIENCRPYFERQLEILQPEYIICWGSVAAKSVLKTTDSVGRLRGRFHSYKQAKVLVTYHPSYLLRTPEAKKLTWEDMKMLMQELGKPIP